MRLSKALEECRGIGPGFHMLRHALSWAILTMHAWYAFRGSLPPKVGSGEALSGSAIASMSYSALGREIFRPSFFALVGMFFALSGFLVAGSAIRTGSIRTFFVNRAMRILPALSVEVTLSALVLGPLVTAYTLADYFSDWRFFRYFGNIVGHISYVLPGVFESNPWPNMVNATLWTLPAEFWCYAIMLVLMITGTVLAKKRLTIGIAAATLAVVGLTLYDPITFNIRDGVTHYSSWYIVIMFLFGVLLYVNAEHIPLSPLLFVVCAVTYYGLMIFDVLSSLSGLPLAYCMVYVGMMRFPTVDRLIPFDLSYGTYLYGFPITQAVIFFLLPVFAPLGRAMSFSLIYTLVLILTVAFSACSWIWIEKPALSMRKHFLREPKPKAA